MAFNLTTYEGGTNLINPVSREGKQPGLNTLELFQEPDIVLRVQPQVIHLIFNLRYALYPHAKCKACVYLRVYTKVAQHIRVHHSATKYFHPAAVFAKVAPAATTYRAGDVHFGTRFCKREVRWPEAHLGMLTKHFSNKVVQRLFKVGKRNVFIYIKAFTLVEEAMRTGRYCFVAVHTAGAYNPYRQRLCLQYTCLGR